jgi:hypothetical protein
MNTIVIFNIAFVLLAYLAQYKGQAYLLKVSFFLIFLFLALRYNYGNDYQPYFDGFLRLTSYSSVDYTDEDEYFEKGWIFLYFLFKPFGFFALVAVLAAFNCFIYYRLIKKYVLPNYYWLAVFIYVFNVGFLLTQLSSMRQTLAIGIFLFAIDYINKKDAIRYGLCIGLASLFHSSALILLPVYLLGVLDWTINKKTATILFLAYLLSFLFGESFLPQINKLVSSNFERYEMYEGSTELGTGLGLIINSIFLILVLYYAAFQNNKISIFFKIVVLSYVLIPISMNLSILVRIIMYFIPFIIIVFPIMMSSINNYFLKTAVLGLIVILTLYDFYLFFNSEIFGSAYKTYTTIFSAPDFY